MSCATPIAAPPETIEPKFDLFLRGARRDS